MKVTNGKLEPATSILEAAEARGIQTGLVSSTQLTHATPAAFYAHVDQRRKRKEIAEAFLDLRQRVPESDGVEVVITGGSADFDAAMEAQLTTEGYDVRRAWDPRATSKENLLMLVSDQGLASATDRQKEKGISLGAMTKVALKKLSSDNSPFFLMVEGGQIDWALHKGDRTTRVADEVKDFDGAVKEAVKFARDRGDTLVIVTADHDHTLSLLGNHYAFHSGRCGAEARCGGEFEALDHPVTVTGVPETDGFTDTKVRGNAPPPALIAQYAWMVQEGMRLADLDAPHSAHLVSVFALGPWATKFAGYQDQPEIGQLLHRWANR